MKSDDRAPITFTDSDTDSEAAFFDDDYTVTDVCSEVSGNEFPSLTETNEPEACEVSSYHDTQEELASFFTHKKRIKHNRSVVEVVDFDDDSDIF